MSTAPIGTKLGLRAEDVSLWEQPEQVWLQKSKPLCERRGPWVLPSVHPFCCGFLAKFKLAGHCASPEIQSRAAGGTPGLSKGELCAERHLQALLSFAQACWLCSCARL